MTIRKILDQLCEERKLIDQAILTLEELEYGRKRGPGRPPNRFRHLLQADPGPAAVANRELQNMHA